MREYFVLSPMAIIGLVVIFLVIWVAFSHAKAIQCKPSFEYQKFSTLETAQKLVDYNRRNGDESTVFESQGYYIVEKVIQLCESTIDDWEVVE